MLSAISAILQPRKVFEFGTFDGRSTLFLALNSPDDSRVTTMDIQDGTFAFGVDTPFFREIKVGEQFLSSEVGTKVRQLTGDSRTFDFSSHEAQYDLIFIDADHSMEGVLTDSRTAQRLLSPGGTIVWHDYLMIDQVSDALQIVASQLPLAHIEGTTLVIHTPARTGI